MTNLPKAQKGSKFVERLRRIDQKRFDLIISELKQLNDKFIVDQAFVAQLNELNTGDLDDVEAGKVLVVLMTKMPQVKHPYKRFVSIDWLLEAFA